MPNFSYFLYFIFIFFFQFIAHSQKENIYSEGTIWKYKISETSTISDTIILEVNNRFSNLNYIEWQYKKVFDDGRIEEVTSKTTVVENEHRLWLHPPREYEMTFTELAPFPEVHYPLKEEKKWNTKLKIEKHAQWAGLTVSNFYEIVSKIDSLKVNGKIYKPIWKISGIGKSDVGVFKVNYFFNPSSGFVRWCYEKPTHEKVTIELIKKSVK